MCNAAYSDPRERQLLKNIMYVGVLSALLGIDPEIIAQLIGEQYKGKEKLLTPNLDAFRKGAHYASEHLDDALGLRVRRNRFGYVAFLLCYQVLCSSASLAGYAQHQRLVAVHVDVRRHRAEPGDKGEIENAGHGTIWGGW